MQVRSDNLFLKIVIVLSLAGILVSGWLLSTHIKFSTGQAGLTESCGLMTIPGMPQGCATVAVSQYSDVFGIPLAAIAMGFYAAILLLSLWAIRNYQAAYEPLYVAFFLSTLSILVTVTMFYISRFVLKSFCIGCSMLWLINLAIWPALVKHLGLSWGNALAANLELLRPKALNLQKQRVMQSLLAGAVCLVAFSIVGVAAESMQRSNASPGEPSGRLIAEFNRAPQVFLPAEAYGGGQAKGLTTAGAAPVLDIVEFSDFQCPACRMAAQYFKPFLLKFSGKVRFSYRHFPLDGACNPHAPNGRHQYACAAARTSICAAAQGKFWEFHDLVFDNQEQLSSAVIDELAVRAGLDKDTLAACLKDPATETQLQKEMEWGNLSGLEATPTIIINGRRLSGFHSPAELESLLQSLDKK